MASLALPSLEVQRFHGFQDLRIEKLGRVNLIVGKNNIGKSSLLQAIQLYAVRGFPTAIWQLLETRDELKGRPVIQTPEEALLSLKYLFFGRKEIAGPIDPITIGPINPEQQLQISIGFFRAKVDHDGNAVWEILQPEEYNREVNLIPRLLISLGKTFSTSYPLENTRYAGLVRTEAKGINIVSIEANGLNEQDIGQLWDKIALTDHEQAVLKALRIIAPGSEAIGIITDSQYKRRIPIVKVKGIPEPLPIRSLGDGMQRMLGIALALVNAQNGILLIDEIENGLHHSIQGDLWKLIFQLAHRLNVQVFATTHSWDCIAGFQKAVEVEESEEGVLTRLDYKKDDITATMFDKRKLAIATQEHIEVR